MENKYKFHIPVLLNEVIEHLNLEKNKNYIDCTVGFSGHTKEILKRTSPNGKLLGIDLDNKALTQSKKDLEEYGERCVFAEDNYSNIEEIVKEKEFGLVDGILFDFGISSYQLEDESRGFSYRKGGRINMGFGKKISDDSTENIINYSDKYELVNIFRKYGELNNFQSKRLAVEIIKTRKEEKIKTAEDLKKIVLRIVPSGFRQESILSRVFQSIRIETNQELEGIERGLKGAIKVLKPQGRLICISYHSLEDRIVKKFFKEESKDCVCPDEIPECRCDHRARIKLITKNNY
ncbi:MAG: 16S rRNA (cytosine(1402)-N(4))-methyltransferase RsmH, partial [Parcubacteria group bacterium]|nr:16S rRNA (cytosine(1402)-N(4))-methyltransferase RsmH [Parcubacteria group bacterium]